MQQPILYLTALMSHCYRTEWSSSSWSGSYSAASVLGITWIQTEDAPVVTILQIPMHKAKLKASDYLLLINTLHVLANWGLSSSTAPRFQPVPRCLTSLISITSYLSLVYTNKCRQIACLWLFVRARENSLGQGTPEENPMSGRVRNSTVQKSSCELFCLFLWNC